MLNQITLEDGPLQRLVFIVQIRKESELIGVEAILDSHQCLLLRGHHVAATEAGFVLNPYLMVNVAFVADCLLHGSQTGFQISHQCIVFFGRANDLSGIKSAHISRTPKRSTSSLLVKLLTTMLLLGLRPEWAI